MNHVKRFLGIFFGLVFPVVSMAATPISICTDANFWYPFSFVRNKHADGLHIDIIRQSLLKLGYEPSFKPLAWNQCLSAVKAGQFDAVATVSYNENRTAFLNYPDDAAKNSRSPWRVTQVDYRVITPISPKKGPLDYTFDGDIKNIPNPVRVPEGYSIIETLEQRGLSVEQAPHSLDNFIKLVKEETGSVIDIEDVAQHLSQQPEFSKKFIISSQPLASKSYFLAFSKRGNISLNEAEKIWQEIANIRDNKHTVSTFLMKY